MVLSGTALRIPPQEHQQPSQVPIWNRNTLLVDTTETLIRKFAILSSTKIRVNRAVFVTWSYILCNSDGKNDSEAMNTTEKLEERYSTQRPPMFSGKYYSYWRNKMEIFIKAENYQVWRVIEVGDFQVTKLNTSGETVPKPIAEFDKAGYEKLELNAMAVKILHCGLGPNEHNRVMGCKNAKQIWDLLQVTHEGTNEVKRSKIDLLMHQYELFTMKSSETIQDMITRFTNIINELNSLGKIITPEEQVRKVLRSLPQDPWMAKVTALQETKDFTKFNLEQLAGSLLTHELQLNARPSENTKNRALALKTENDENSEEDEETALFARRFRRMFRNYKEGDHRSKPNRKFSKTDIGCHKCGNLEHRIRECLLWEQERGKGKETAKDRFKDNKNSFSKNEVRKAMIAAWGDSSSDEEQDQPNEETAHLCLVAENEEDGSDSEFEKFQASLVQIKNRLKSLSKLELFDLLSCLTSNYEELLKEKLDSDKKHQTTVKKLTEDLEWTKNTNVDIDNRFFSLFYQNLHIKEICEALRNENSLLKQELIDLEVAKTKTLYKSELERTQLELVKIHQEKTNLEEELARKTRHRIEGTPKWIEEARTKRTEGLGFNHKKRHPRKTRVDLYSDIVCTFCGDRNRFLSLTTYEGGTVTFGDNKKGNIIGIGKVGKSKSHSIDNVFLVEGLGHSLLSISQFCDKGNYAKFFSNKCLIINSNTETVILEGQRKGNTYVVNLNSVPQSNLTCLSVIEDDPLLWHK
ncbi:uncharacterized protein [Spinacia oleracea]|uniref:Retrovirus-related Pol polyprotein from transposon TNT 1-94-like beta-barrel domain-containing protein n=1 Tax=Spinacia oleracea TaxID=3562 RepID=A0ABM3R3W5_SPIOL|nr:uncharacterized protein LOC130465535 [Spinacia oleracea]